MVVTMSVFSLAGEPDKVFHEKCLYPTVMVMNQTPKGVGTGVIVKSVKKDDHFENFVLTCAHVLVPMPMEEPEEQAPPPPPNQAASATLAYPIAIRRDKYEVKVRIGVYENWSTLVGSKDYDCKVLYTDKNKDIAIVVFDTENQNQIAEVDKDPKLYIGNDVVKVGCGLSEPFRIDHGKITSVSKSIGNMIKDTYRVSAPTVMGDSGGPVYHENKLVGLSQAVRSAPISGTPFSTFVPHMGYMLPVKRFYDSERATEILKD